MRFRALSSWTLVLAGLYAGRADASSIGVFFDREANDCDMAQPVGTSGTLYVLAVLGGDPAADGITGAEYRILGFPSEWTVLENAPNPAAPLFIGDPLGAGIDIGFADCQTGGSLHVVLLHTIRYQATTFVDNRCLEVVRHVTPANPLFPCQSVTRCNASEFTRICIVGGTATLNGSCTDPELCTTVGLNPRPWSTIKSLYRDL